MTDVLAVPSRLGGVRQLLAEAGLPPLDAPPDRLAVRVAERGGRVVGCVAVEGEGAAGLLRSLAVAPEARGGGLGGRLVDAAEDLARERGMDALYLLTTTAAPFFEARGYRPVDRADVPASVRASREFASVCPASAACLGKALRPA